ncbi:MAG: thioesterase family protein [Acidimicrobiales bacterium]|jgi:acyl-CoA thioesterase|nr:thioesterase family protein [Acidimicrobiales bacterium]
MTWQFDAETAVESRGDGLWITRLSDRWNIGDNPNGGYLVAVTLQALRQLGPHPHPVSVTSHFLRPGTGDAPGEVRTSLVRSGRSVTTARATLVQEGRERLEVLASFGDLSGSSGHSHELVIDPPDMPPPEDCAERSGLEQGVELHIQSRIDMRVRPDLSSAGSGERAETLGWIRFRDGRDPDSLGAVLFADAFPPPIFGLLGRVGWVPTIELTVHVRRRPAPGWMLGRFMTDDLHDGRMIEDGWLWDSSGALVARSRQLAILLED